jgi:hypothetical protein
MPSVLDRFKDKAVDRLAESILTVVISLGLLIASPVIAFLLWQDLTRELGACANCGITALSVQLHLGAVFACGLLVGATGSIIAAWYIRRSRVHRHQAERAGNTWKLIDKYAAERQVIEYGMFVTFGRGRIPKRWEINEEIICLSRKSKLDNMATYISYGGGMEDLTVRPLGAHNAATGIKIVDLRRVNDHRYEFLINFLPPVSPKQSRKFKYALMPTNPGPAKPYMAADSRDLNPTGSYTFQVEFDSRELPVDHVVRKVYWPTGKGEDWTDFVELAVGQVSEQGDWGISFEFTEQEVRQLDEKYSANPIQRRYGIVWDWSPASPTRPRTRAQQPSTRDSLGRLLNLTKK